MESRTAETRRERNVVRTPLRESAQEVTSKRRQSKMEAERRHCLRRTLVKLRLTSHMARGRRLRRTKAGGDPHPPRRPSKGKTVAGKEQAQRQGGEGWLAPDTVVMGLLYLLCTIVAVQMYHGEDMEKNIQAYDIDHLEKTLHRELVGQTLAINKLTKLLRGYLATNFHSKPLVLSVNGPTGVGKSYLGRLITKHFRSALGTCVVIQHSAKHHSPLDLISRVADTFSRARQACQVPVLLLDQLEYAGPQLLNFVGQLVASPNHTTAVYILLTNIGSELIIQSTHRGFGHGVTGQVQRLSAELARLTAGMHPIWREAKFIPLFPLHQLHVVQCARQAMEREGFYPQDPRAEAMAKGLSYYKARQHLYSKLGCKPVLPRVRQIKRDQWERGWM
ncbi:torsin-4A-like isoform X1 [Hemitrygon akajei]|uniref:torsin-4A-like isoform X1 n=2 Tax=Hemitrygon akajei TaxID=2704970 RepID=UPI003BF9C73B